MKSYYFPSRSVPRTTKNLNRWNYQDLCAPKFEWSRTGYHQSSPISNQGIVVGTANKFGDQDKIHIYGKFLKDPFWAKELSALPTQTVLEWWHLDEENNLSIMVTESVPATALNVERFLRIISTEIEEQLDNSIMF